MRPMSLQHDLPRSASSGIPALRRYVAVLMSIVVDLKVEYDEVLDAVNFTA